MEEGIAPDPGYRPLAVEADEAGEVSVNGSWDPLEALAEEGDGLAERPEEPPASAEGRELRFIRLSERATLPTRAHDSDAGLDLYAAEAASVAPGGRVSVGTGLAVQIPEGLAGLVLPRSGLSLKHGIALVNSPGLIDPGYRGEVRVLLLNTDPTLAFRVAPGDRIAQLLLVPIAVASPLEADSLDTSTRGPAGFGSSGH
jgi:dUTP pyrophosphatase